MSRSNLVLFVFIQLVLQVLNLGGCVSDLVLVLLVLGFTHLALQGELLLFQRFVLAILHAVQSG